MSSTTAERALCVALLGNPNTGKSTLFHALTGIHQHVGNYPGVTIEKKMGHYRSDDGQVTVIDLPGMYSLAPRSPDEMIAMDVLLGRVEKVPAPDLVLCVLDASNLERNLYLVGQILELDLPMVIALNMVDVATAGGTSIDVERLSQNLGVPVVAIHAKRKTGIEDLKTALSQASSRPSRTLDSVFPQSFQSEVANLQSAIGNGSGPMPRYLAERLLLDANGYLEGRLQRDYGNEWTKRLTEARNRLESEGLGLAHVEPNARYGWVEQILDGVIHESSEKRKSLTDRADRFLVHPIWGGLLTALVMAALFQAVFSIAEPASTAIDWMKNGLASLINLVIPVGPLQSLLVDGLVEGVGGVLVFLPQIFLLFLLIAVLEDCGYLARIAYLMDQIMSRVGLSGKSFIPLLSSFACAIPGIMAARVIEDRRDRLVTILIAPLMSCSARLPVYTLLIAAFIPNSPVLGGFLGLQGITLFAMYCVGIITAVIVAFVLKKTILRAETPTFVMELPTYKWPSIGVVMRRMLDGGWAFISGAGTLIVAVTILVWAAAYYPRDRASLDASLVAHQDALQSRLDQLKTGNDSSSDPIVVAQTEEQLAEVENEVQASYLRQSFLGRAGRLIEPVVRPLGWDWRIGCAAIASFPAREVVVATLGVVYKLGADQDEESESLRQTLQSATWDGTDRRVFNVPVALSIMVFFALCAQCVSTLAVMKRETNTWRWPVFTFVYMTTAAYLGAMVTYKVGMMFVS